MTRYDIHLSNREVVSVRMDCDIGDMSYRVFGPDGKMSELSMLKTVDGRDVTIRTDCILYVTKEVDG